MSATPKMALRGLLLTTWIDCYKHFVYSRHTTYPLTAQVYLSALGATGRLRAALSFMGESMRTIVYVDGYNLYYGLLRKSAYKWLDLYSLFQNHVLHQSDALNN
jgi:hypothetical protein